MRLIDLYNIKGLEAKSNGGILEKLFPVRRYVLGQEQFIYNKITGLTDTQTMLETVDLLKYNKEIPSSYINTIQEGVMSIFDDLVNIRRNSIAHLLQTGKIHCAGDGEIRDYDYNYKIKESDIKNGLKRTDKNSPAYAIVSDSPECRDIREELSSSGFIVWANSYFKGRTATLLSTLNVGNTLIGVTPGEAEMMNGIDYSVMSADNSINITLTECKEEFSGIASNYVETKMEQLFLPTFKDDIILEGDVIDKITIIKF